MSAVVQTVFQALSVRSWKINYPQGDFCGLFLPQIPFPILALESAWTERLPCITPVFTNHFPLFCYTLLILCRFWNSGFDHAAEPSRKLAWSSEYYQVESKFWLSHWDLHALGEWLSPVETEVPSMWSWNSSHHPVGGEINATSCSSPPYSWAASLFPAVPFGSLGMVLEAPLLFSCLLVSSQSLSPARLSS